MNTLTKKTRISIKNASKVLGVDEKDILERASIFYLNAVKQELDFKKELDMWERASIEDMRSFEKSL